MQFLLKGLIAGPRTGSRTARRPGALPITGLSCDARPRSRFPQALQHRRFLQLQLEVHGTVCRTIIHVLFKRLKPEHLNRHVPRAGRKRRESVMAVCIRYGGNRLAVLRCGYCCAWKRLPAGSDESALGKKAHRNGSQKNERANAQMLNTCGNDAATCIQVTRMKNI